MVTLHTKVTDRITGFTGTAVCRTEFKNGCVRIGVQPLTLKDGIPEEKVFVNELDIIENDPATTKPIHPILGKACTDKITGFKGVAVLRTEYTSSEPRIALQAKTLHEGKPVDLVDFDESDLEWASAPKAKAKPGGPGDHAPRLRQAPRP